MVASPQAMAGAVSNAMSNSISSALSALLASALPDAVGARSRRQAAARALATDPRRAQLGWDDLGAWPDWAGLAPDALCALQRNSAIWLHAADWQRCICGARLQQVQLHLGNSAFAWLMASPQAGGAPATGLPAPGLPDAAELDQWLLDEGREVLLASVGSAVLRVLLRERLWPRSLPPLPARDSARARQALVSAQVSARAPALASAARPA